MVLVSFGSLPVLFSLVFGVAFGVAAGVGVAFGFGSLAPITIDHQHHHSHHTAGLAALI